MKKKGESLSRSTIDSSRSSEMMKFTYQSVFHYIYDDTTDDDDTYHVDFYR
jgi:hypothetical protein